MSFNVRLKHEREFLTLLFFIVENSLAHVDHRWAIFISISDIN